MVPLTVNIDIDKKINISQSERSISNKTDNSFFFGCGSYLILDKNYRGNGLGMVLIQESLQILYDNGGLGSYFINTVSRCDNSIPLIKWIYPLNLDKLDSCHFVYPNNYRNRFEIGEKSEAIKVDEINIKEVYDFYIEYMKDKKVYFSPSLEYYRKWIKMYPTYILKDEKIEGLFSLRSNVIWYPTLRTNINTGYCITCIGKNIDIVIKQVLYEAKKYFDVLIFYELGDVNSNNLNNIFAQKNHKAYINFFNTTFKLDKSEFYAPPL